MKSLQKTVMVYVTILLVVVGFAAATVSYFFVKGEVNSFQDNALQEVALNAGLVFRHDIQPHIDAELEDQLVVQIWDHSEKPIHRSGPPVEIPYQSELGYSDVTAGGERWRVFSPVILSTPYRFRSAGARARRSRRMRRRALLFPDRGYSSRMVADRLVGQEGPAGSWRSVGRYRPPQRGYEGRTKVDGSAG